MIVDNSELQKLKLGANPGVARNLVRGGGRAQRVQRAHTAGGSGVGAMRPPPPRIFFFFYYNQFWRHFQEHEMYIFDMSKDQY